MTSAGDVLHAQSQAGRRRVLDRLEEGVSALVRQHVADHAVGDLDARRRRVHHEIVVEVL